MSHRAPVPAARNSLRFFIRVDFRLIRIPSGRLHGSVEVLIGKCRSFCFTTEQGGPGMEKSSHRLEKSSYRLFSDGPGLLFLILGGRYAELLFETFGEIGGGIESYGEADFADPAFVLGEQLGRYRAVSYTHLTLPTSDLV
mgnify:CR=1 FL=1